MTATSSPLPSTGARLNDGCEYREQLGHDAEGQVLIAYLSQRYDHSSAMEWAERIASSSVLIDGLPACSESVLRRGSELVWQRPPWIEPDAPTSFTVLYEDEDLLAAVIIGRLAHASRREFSPNNAAVSGARLCA